MFFKKAKLVLPITLLLSSFVSLVAPVCIWLIINLLIDCWLWWASTKMQVLICLEWIWLQWLAEYKAVPLLRRQARCELQLQGERQHHHIKHPQQLSHVCAAIVDTTRRWQAPGSGYTESDVQNQGRSAHLHQKGALLLPFVHASRMYSITPLLLTFFDNIILNNLLMYNQCVYHSH